MRPAVKMAFLFSGTWIALKLVFWGLDIFQEDVLKPGLINNFLLLTAISFGLYLEKKREGFGVGTPLSDIKNALRAGAVYVLIVSGFMYLYYEHLNPTFIENRIETRMDSIYSEMEDEAYVDSLRAHNNDFKVLTKDEIYREILTDTESGLSANTLFIFSLLGLIVLALSYSIFLTLIFRKILLKDYYQNQK